MTVVGMLVRGVTILSGILALAVVLLLEVAFFIIWIAMPVIIVFLLSLGITLLIR